MFLVDDILLKVVDWLAETLKTARGERREAVANSRKAMRKLASSLDEAVRYLEAGVHDLERSIGSREDFSKALSQLVGQENLQRNCSEAGVCEDLRVAQDELSKLPESIRFRPNAPSVDDLIREIDGYERQFVAAVREFLGKARGYDLTALNKDRSFDPEQALEALKERVLALKVVAKRVEDAADSLRQEYKAKQVRESA